MAEPPREHQKLLQDIDKLMSEAPDDASRRDLERLRAGLTSPEMVEMAREIESSRPRPRDNLVLEFHDPWLPQVLTMGGSVVSAAVCLFAVVGGFRSSFAQFQGVQYNLWLVAAFAGALTALFTALSFLRSFSVRVDTHGMATRASGARWRGLRVGAMHWKNIRSLRERQADRVLEVHAAGGEMFEIPTRVMDYPILRHHLDNMVLFYGTG